MKKLKNTESAQLYQSWALARTFAHCKASIFGHASRFFVFGRANEIFGVRDQLCKISPKEPYNVLNILYIMMILFSYIVGDIKDHNLLNIISNVMIFFSSIVYDMKGK